MDKPVKKYKGVIVPMITPFKEDYSVDIISAKAILEQFVIHDVSPFILGTTGESVSIPEKQKILLVKTTVDYLHNKILIYAGISGNCLEESVEQAKKYAGMGVDAVVAHVPFYYPLSEKQVLNYFESLADKIPCPLILYNMPTTTKHSISLETIEKLSYHPNIAGLKDSERGQERLEKAIAMWSKRDDFSHLTGWAARSAFALTAGSDGIVPSTGNLTPQLYKELFEAATKNQIQQAADLQKITDTISNIYQLERNLNRSIPALKIMMAYFGLCKPFVLPPLDMPETEEKNIIIKNLEEVIKKYPETFNKLINRMQQDKN